LMSTMPVVPSWVGVRQMLWMPSAR